LTPSSKTHQDPHFSGELDVMTRDAPGGSHLDRNIPAMYRSDAALLQHLTCSFRQARKRNKMGGFKVVAGVWIMSFSFGGFAFQIMAFTSVSPQCSPRFQYVSAVAGIRYS
jgi:hypothetical protein